MAIIIDTGLGNVGSVANMLRRIGAHPVVSDDAETIANADRLILPGVGAFDAGMAALAEMDIIGILHSHQRSGTPILGLCLGCQLMTLGSEEGTMPGLGWINAYTVRFRRGITVPHMGWSIVTGVPDRPTALLNGSWTQFYFAHSYHVCDGPHTLAYADYHGLFPALMRAGNVTGAQFHPEKSHRRGMAFLRAWLEGG